MIGKLEVDSSGAEVVQWALGGLLWYRIILIHKSISTIYKKVPIYNPFLTTHSNLFTSTPLTPFLTRVNSRSRANILEARVVNRLCEDGITGLVTPRKANTTRRRTASTRNLNLEATNIRLRVVRTSMQRNRLGADQVVTARNVLGDGKGALSAVCVEDLGAPGRCCACVPVFGDFEERTRGRGFCVGDFGHVHEDGAVMVAADGGLGAGACVGLGVHFYG